MQKKKTSTVKAFKIFICLSSKKSLRLVGKAGAKKNGLAQRVADKRALEQP